MQAATVIEGEEFLLLRPCKAGEVVFIFLVSISITYI